MTDLSYRFCALTRAGCLNIPDMHFPILVGGVKVNYKEKIILHIPRVSTVHVISLYAENVALARLLLTPPFGAELHVCNIQSLLKLDNFCTPFPSQSHVSHTKLPFS